MTFVPLLEGMETNKAFLGRKILALMKSTQVMLIKQELQKVRQFVVLFSG